jgi:hypothetical protein
MDQPLDLRAPEKLAASTPTSGDDAPLWVVSTLRVVLPIAVGRRLSFIADQSWTRML